MTEEDRAKLRVIRAGIIRDHGDLKVLIKAYWWDRLTPQGKSLEMAGANLEQCVAEIDAALGSER